MQDQVYKCDHCKNGTLKFVAWYAAPGTGQSWECESCNHPYQKIGTTMVDLKPKDEEPCGNYRVWQWGIEIRLGSHGQTKMSSSFIKHGFDSKAEAMVWAAIQDKSDWGVWGAYEAGEYVDLCCPYSQLPKSYSEAMKMKQTVPGC